MKSITTAIENLPEELITPEIVAAALPEGKIELLNCLPEKYLTEGNINLLVENDKSWWGHFDLERIPVSYRNQAVSNCAVKKHKDNYRHVSDELKTSDMLNELMSSVTKYFHLLDCVPESHWNNAVLYSGIKSLYREQSNSYSRNKSHFYENRDSSSTKATKLIQVLLSFVPGTVKNKSFYHELWGHVVIPAKDIVLLTPGRFKDSEFYLLMACWAFDLVPEERYSYQIFFEAINGNNVIFNVFRQNANTKEKFFALMDDDLADATVKKDPWFFKELPEEFQTPQRMLFLIENNPEYRNYDRLIDDGDEKILTKEVCEALVKRNTQLPKFPDNVWTEEFAEFCKNHTGSFHWFEQMPHCFQTQESVNAATNHWAHLIEYVHPAFINSHLAMNIFRMNNNYKKYLPEKHFSEFTQTTGLPEEFFGGETSFANLKENKPDYSYCPIGNTFIGFHKDSRYRDSSSYVTLTRIPGDGGEAEVVFKRKVGSFHQTWLEKIIADYDRDFVKPTISKTLKEIQTNLYCGIETAGGKDGIDFFRVTFRGETIRFAGRKDGNIIYGETKEEVISRLQSASEEKEVA